MPTTSNNGPSLAPVPRATSSQPVHQPHTSYLLPCPLLPVSRMVNVYALRTRVRSTSLCCPPVLTWLTSSLALPCTCSFCCDDVQCRMHRHLQENWVHDCVSRRNHHLRPKSAHGQGAPIASSAANLLAIPMAANVNATSSLAKYARYVHQLLCSPPAATLLNTPTTSTKLITIPGLTLALI
jgi:hypothetical protein